MSKKIIILGGGLWGSLLAYFFHLRRPDLTFELYERGEGLGGDHTWSFHTSDVTPELWSVLKPLVSFSWSGQEVIFPKLQRKLSVGYHSILSSDLDHKLRAILPKAQILLGQAREPQDFGKDCVVFDTRNLKLDVPGAWQNFVGLDVELTQPHGLAHPIIMDANVEQLSGFRFIYYLPWGPSQILVEDTRYTEDKEIPVEQWRRGVEELIALKGWTISSIKRVEVGSLPIPFSSPYHERSNVVNLSGIFHDVTGYSIADAFRVCDALTQSGTSSLNGFQLILSQYNTRQSSRRRYYRLLNRLMFKASDKLNRYKMLQHFYHLPQASIERFYAGQSSLWDRLRVFIGKPPVSIWRALKVIFAKETV